MERRRFLGAAAALTALSAADTADAATDTDGDAEDGDAAATQHCEVCGVERPAAFVDHTTVKPIAPAAADICRVCQHVQTHDPGEQRCLQCGTDAAAGFTITIAFPLGVAALPAERTGALCGDCASSLACEITYDGVDADDDASQRLSDLIDAEHRLRNRGDAD